MTNPPTNKVLGTPNKMLWEFYSALMRQTELTSQLSEENEKRQNVAVCIILSVTLVDTFLNMFFRVVASEKQFEHAKDQILKDFRDQISLERKIKEWPKTAFGHSIDFSKGVGQDFIKLKDQRNGLMHFSSTYESVTFENITIQGLADISKYESLHQQDAISAVQTTEAIISEILKTRGIPSEQIPTNLLFWLGRIPQHQA